MEYGEANQLAEFRTNRLIHFRDENAKAAHDASKENIFIDNMP
jgi:hypothetical protein